MWATATVCERGEMHGAASGECKRIDGRASPVGGSLLVSMCTDRVIKCVLSVLNVETIHLLNAFYVLCVDEG